MFENLTKDEVKKLMAFAEAKSLDDDKTMELLYSLNEMKEAKRKSAIRLLTQN